MRGRSFVLVVLLAATTGACSYAHIGSGEVGVVRTPDGIEQHVYTPIAVAICGSSHMRLRGAS